MRKTFYLLIFFSIIFQAVIAQQPSAEKFRKFELKGGVNISHMNFNKGVPAPPVPIRTNWKPGLFLGFSLRVPLGKGLSLQPEYVFSKNGSDLSGSGISYRLSYISMPLLLRYQILPFLHLMAGPQLDLLINAKKDSSGTVTTITHDTEERNVGLAIALEYRIFKTLHIEARYAHGLNHVGIGQRSSVTEFKWQVFRVGLGCEF